MEIAKYTAALLRRRKEEKPKWNARYNAKIDRRFHGPFVAPIAASRVFGVPFPDSQRSHRIAFSGQEALAKALALADLYNWADAAPLFQRAQAAFEQAGDSRNALHARLGLLRANIERQQQTLPTISHELGIELEENPHLQADKRLRLLALIVKGDIDAETDTAAMKQDWQEVQALAEELGDKKWSYRALGQLGVAAFYEGDIETARKSAGAAIAAAAAAGDVGAQIRMLTILGRGLVETKAFNQALPYLEQALTMALPCPLPGSVYHEGGSDCRAHRPQAIR